jgi:alanine racemase
LANSGHEPIQYRATVAKIDLDALRHNVRQLRKLQLNPDQFFCPMVKADAYGHGDIQVSKALLSEGITHLGVATLEEGLNLRAQLGPGFGILVFAPSRDQGARAAIEGEVTPVFSQWSDIEAFEKNLYQKAGFKVHVKFNSGMNRLGFSLDEAEKLARYFRDNDRFVVEGVCTHLADGEDAHSEKARTAQQLQKFFMAARSFRGSEKNNPVHFHALNSAALIGAHCGRQKNHLEFGARPGISLYGIKPQLTNPTGEITNAWQQVELKPVLSLVTEIIHLQKIKSGESVSYGGRWTSSRDSVVAVVPIGYADGLSRQLSNKGRMLIRGEEVPIVGTVCMDYTMVDVTSFGDSSEIIGENVTVIGQQGARVRTADQLAELVGTNPYEILTSISRRVPRVYK